MQKFKTISWSKAFKVKTEYNLTNEELGKLVEVSGSTVSSWFHGRDKKTNLLTWDKLDFLYRNKNLKFKWLVKLLVRFY